jgi:hypothetical protein
MVERRDAALKRKTVYLNGIRIGTASTWHEVGALLTSSLRRSVGAREALESGSEGPDGFYVNMTCRQA